MKRVLAAFNLQEHDLCILEMETPLQMDTYSCGDWVISLESAWLRTGCQRTWDSAIQARKLIDRLDWPVIHNMNNRILLYCFCVLFLYCFILVL